MRCLAYFVVFSWIASGGPIRADEPSDLNTRLMLSTVKLTNPASAGTAFFLAQRGDAQAEDSPLVLVTADHVFSRMQGNEATLHLRQKQPDGGYAKLLMPLAVRRDAQPLWVKHPTADVAVMRISLPPEASIPGVPAELLATEEQLRHYEIQPGDMTRSLGYPHPHQFEANAEGFGIVRVGCIASYPLWPTERTGRFYLDANIFEGDSGGPVYLSQMNRFFQGETHSGRVELILGLMSGQQMLNERFDQVYQSGEFRHRLGLGLAVHAAAIRQTLELLPGGSKAESSP